ncbi:hypothetical protein [Peribacillus frigoritolerans]|uniref:hypothetical protein n=1 Tax=Peribacillus frigoritolerans TaxID=450367 RepID=UPI003D2A056E
MADTPWYDLKITYTLIGALISLTTFFVTQVLTNKREEKKMLQTLLYSLVQGHGALFSIIYIGALDEDKLDYLSLRKELLKTGGFVNILPVDIKEDFNTLYLIHTSDNDYYLKNKNKIHPLLKSIINKIVKYGGKAFGYKPIQ